ncbi:MAG: CHAT domain-containing protein, partial [Pseudomonadales bacterium]
PRLALLLGGTAERSLAALSEPVVYYAVGESGSHVILARPGSSGSAQLNAFPLPDREAIRAASARLQTLLATPDSAREAVQAAAASLHEMIWLPVADSLGEAAFVTIVADDVLHGLPFAALFDADRQQYLVEQHSFSIATSLRDAFSAEQAKMSGSSRYAGVAYSSAAPGDDSQAEAIAARRSGSGEPLLPLRYAATEVQQAAALFAPRAQVLLEQQATESAVNALADVDIAHFAAHFVLDHAEPLNSYLALAPGAGEDGELRLAEVMQDLRLDARLAVLSACDSAVGPLYAGEGLIGLSKAFAYAGADQVLATLWPVMDAVSADVMRRFYQTLALGIPTAQALQTAQLQALRGQLEANDTTSYWQRLRSWWRQRVPANDTSHPYYWAPYVLTQSGAIR